MPDGYEIALRHAENLLDEALDPLAAQQVGLTAALALVDLGRHEEAVRILDRLLAVASPDVTGRGDVLFVLAEAAHWGGRPDEALSRLAEYREFEGSEYPTSFLVDVTAGWAALEAGRTVPAPFAIGEPAGMLVAARLERGAIEAAVAGDDLDAVTGFDRAADAYVGFHRRGELRSRWAAAEWRRRAGDPSAVTELEALEAPLAGDGFGPLLVRVHRSLRLLGERRMVRVPATGEARLTAREQEIATPRCAWPDEPGDRAPDGPRAPDGRPAAVERHGEARCRLARAGRGQGRRPRLSRHPCSHRRGAGGR